VRPIILKEVCYNCPGGVKIMLFNQLNYFRHNIKAEDPDKDASGEAHYGVELVLEFNREQTTEKGGEKRR